MNEKTKKVLHKANDIFSWVLLIAMALVLVYSVFVVTNANKDEDGAFIFGYRPIMVLTGSMEPYIMTNGMALTQEVTDLGQLEEGDVISYHVTQDDGSTVRITHRITAIEDGVITTQGDNNRVPDAYPLTIDNVEAKVVLVFNQTAWLAATWQTTSGKILICSAIAGTLLLYLGVKSYRKACREEKEAQSAQQELTHP